MLLSNDKIIYRIKLLMLFKIKVPNEKQYIYLNYEFYFKLVSFRYPNECIFVLSAYILLLWHII